MKFLAIVFFVFLASYVVAHSRGRVQWTPNLKSASESTTRLNSSGGSAETEELRSIVREKESSLEILRAQYNSIDSINTGDCPNGPAFKIQEKARVQDQILYIEADLIPLRYKLAHH